jgi:hypothetical protein
MEWHVTLLWDGSDFFKSIPDAYTIPWFARVWSTCHSWMPCPSCRCMFPLRIDSRLYVCCVASFMECSNFHVVVLCTIWRPHRGLKEGSMNTKNPPKIRGGGNRPGRWVLCTIVIVWDISAWKCAKTSGFLTSPTHPPNFIVLFALVENIAKLTRSQFVHCGFGIHPDLQSIHDRRVFFSLL